MQMPNITPAQIAAAVKLAVAVATALGLNVSGDLSDAVTEFLIGAVSCVSTGIVIADAIIRHGRSRVLTSPDSLAQIERPKAPVIG